MGNFDRNLHIIKPYERMSCGWTYMELLTPYFIKVNLEVLCAETCIIGLVVMFVACNVAL